MAAQVHSHNLEIEPKSLTPNAFPAGASLLAIAVAHPAHMLTDLAPSRAGSLPHGGWLASAAELDPS
ncbi:hypothetical protein EMIT0196MI5_100038 [Pseudomonas sp. IT-196MI5]